MASATSNYSLPYPLSSDNVNINSDIQTLAVAVDSELLDQSAQISGSVNLLTASANNIYSILDTKADLTGDVFTGAIYQNLGSLSTVPSSNLLLMSASVATSNTDKLTTKAVRLASGSDWQTAQLKVQRETDGSGYEYIGFGASAVHGIEIGVQESPVALFTYDDIKLFKSLVSNSTASFSGTVDVATPVLSTHAATKGYVDGITTGGYLLTNSQSTSYTLALSDLNKIIEVTAASSASITIPSNSSVPLANGFAVDIIQIGAGAVTIVPDAGVTLQSKDGFLKLSGQYAAVSLYKRSTDTWAVIGDLIA